MRLLNELKEKKKRAKPKTYALLGTLEAYEKAQAEYAE